MIANHPIETIAPARQTSLGLYVTAKDAYDMWQADPGRRKSSTSARRGVRLRRPRADGDEHPPRPADVRVGSRQEGPPLGGQPRLRRGGAGLGEAGRHDPRFVPLGGPQRDGDQRPRAAGFTRVYNILDGMEGSVVKDPDSVFDGMRMKNGWKNSGLPWTYDIDPARMKLPPRQSRSFVPATSTTEGSSRRE